MPQQHGRTPFKKALWHFIAEPGPFLAILNGAMTERMRIKAEAEVGAAKGTHAEKRAAYSYGVRAGPDVRPGEALPICVIDRTQNSILI